MMFFPKLDKVTTHLTYCKLVVTFLLGFILNSQEQSLVAAF